MCSSWRMTDLTLQKWRQGLQSPGGWHQQGQPPRLTPQKHPGALPCWRPAAQAQCSVSSTTLPSLHPAQPHLPCMQCVTQDEQDAANCCQHSPAVPPVMFTHWRHGWCYARLLGHLPDVYIQQLSAATPGLCFSRSTAQGKMSLACTGLPGSNVTVTTGLA